MARLIPIDDPDDPRVAAYRDVRERDLVGRQDLFVAEGEVVLRVLARSPLCAPVSLLLAEKRVAGLTEIIDALPQDTPVYVAGQAVMDRLVGFPIHRGILALGRRTAAPAAAELLAGLPEEVLVLALCGIANHDNLGGLFRNAAAFGVQAVILDETCADPLYRKAIRVSVGAALITPFARLRSGEEMLDLLRGHGFEPVALSPRGAVTLAELPRSARTAVVLGAEGPGLPEDLLSRTKAVRIPMADGFDSLNVAVTAGVVLHHLRFVARPSGRA